MPAPMKDYITFADFEKLDIRLGTIIKVEDIEESDTLLKFTVDFGEEQPKTILCNMKGERENDYAIEGVQTLFVVNLKPRKMFGHVSEGMLLDIGYQDGLRPSALAIPEFKIPNGSRAG